MFADSLHVTFRIGENVLRMEKFDSGVVKELPVGKCDLEGGV